MKLISITAPYLIAAIVVILSAHWGASHALGAHPFWSLKVALIGVPIGLMFAIVFRRARWMKCLIGFALGLVFAGAAAHFGRLRFAASFAEDRLAGQFWFFGWLAVAVFLTALIAVILTPGARRT